MTELKVYRRSELQTVDAGCLHAYDQIWRKGVDEMSDLALIGIGFHAVNHAYIMRLVQHGLPSDDEEAKAAFQEGVVAVQTPSRLLPELRHLWEDFHAPIFTLDVDRFVAAEERQTSGQVTWAPDLILAHPERNELEDIDYKSGWAPPPTEDELRMLFQARVYSYYMMKRWPGFSSYRFTLVAVRWATLTSVVFTLSDLDGVERELQAHIATVEDAERRGVWPAVAGPACAFCSLLCPIESPAQIPKRIHTPEAFQHLASYALSAETQRKGVMKALKNYVAGHGPQMVNGLEFANRPTTERRYPIDVVMKVLKKRGIMGAFEAEVKPTDLTTPDTLTISHSSLKKLFVAFPMLADDLQPAAMEKINYRFGAKKPGVSDNEGEDE